MSDRLRRRRSRELRVAPSPREHGGLSPASRLRIAADVHRHSTSDDDSGCVLEEYAWVPSGLKPDAVHAYFSCLPDDKIPYVGSAGEKWRMRQLRHQLPPQDSDSRYCEALSKEEQDEIRIFERRRKSECLGRGIVQRVPYDGSQRNCPQCQRHVEEGELCVFASRTSSFYHPACFECHECSALLVDLVYFSHQGMVFCGRHHAEQIKPRCAKCDELIFAVECTEAEGRTWHNHHFQCTDCNEVLAGRKYMQKSNKPVCMKCFHSTGATISCSTCRGNIAVESTFISQGDFTWHADSRCFACCVCSKNLLGRKYTIVGTHLYCGYKTCGGEDDLSDSEDVSRSVRHSTRTRLHKATKPPRAPTRKTASPQCPRPPQRAPPPPPSEHIYETVLPCTSDSVIDWKPSSELRSPSSNYYCRTPNRQLQQEEPHLSSTSSSDSEDDEFYISNVMAAASLGRQTSRPQTTSVRIAKKKKSSHCIVS